MSGTNRTVFLIQHELCENKCRLNESACNSKRERNHDKFWQERKELDDWVSCTCDCECNKTWKGVGSQGTKNCSCEKDLIDKLVLACEDEILTTTKISLDDEKVTCDKINLLVHNILLIIMSLILIVFISIGCYYYYTRDWIKNEPVISQQYKIINLKETNIKSCTFSYFDDIIKVEYFDVDNISLDEKSFANISIF